MTTDPLSHPLNSTLKSSIPERFARAKRVPCLTILWHPDPEAVGRRHVMTERTLAVSRDSPRFSAPDGSGAALKDPRISRKPLTLTIKDDDSLKIDASELSVVVTLDGESLLGARVVSADAISRGVVLTLAYRVVVLLHFTDPQVLLVDHPLLIGRSSALQRVREKIRRLVDLDNPVLVRGESGVGKELVARALHEDGPRRKHALLAVNVAAWTSSLASAALFGAEKGAYTGAEQKRLGVFEEAGEGTLFLDEIGDIAPEVQSLFLRALETREITPVGGAQPRIYRARVVAATDADLESAMDDDEFRRPLFHRLAATTIEVPPLRARREDLGLLICRFLRLEYEALGEEPRLDDPDRNKALAGIVARLALRDWPGNVRELRNAVREAVLVGREEGVPRLEEKTSSPLDPRQRSAPTAARGRSLHRPPGDVSPGEMLAALEEADWEFQAAADKLGMARTTLYKKAKKHPDVRFASELEEEEIRSALERRDGRIDAAARDLRVSSRALQGRIRDLDL